MRSFSSGHGVVINQPILDKLNVISVKMLIVDLLKDLPSLGSVVHNFGKCTVVEARALELRLT